MTLINSHYLYTPTAFFDEVDLGSNVSFSIKRGSDCFERGYENRYEFYTYQRNVSSVYNLNIPVNNRAEIEDLAANLKSFKVKGRLFFFDDFSDNFVLPWQTQSGYIKQFGKLIATAPGNANNSYYGVKIYQAGNNFGYRVIRGYHPNAEVRINNSIVTSGLDRNTGIFSGAGFSEGNDFTTDQYYTLVSVDSDFEYTAFAGSTGQYWNIMNNTVTDTKPCPHGQKYSMSFQLTESNLLDTENLDLLPVVDTTLSATFDIRDFDRDAKVKELYKTTTTDMRSSRVITRSNAALTNPVKEVTITPATVKHRELIKFVTLFRATKGGHFKVS